MQKLARHLFLSVSLFLVPGLLNGAVTNWEFLKGRGGVLSADNTAPAMTSWDVEIFVETDAVGDATAVSISGGGIDGSLAFALDGTEWIYERDYASEAAMDAVFPNSASYTITLSGGSLGTVTQTFTLGTKAYPDLLYLTGTGYSALQNFDPSSSFDFVFASSSVTGDLIAIEIEEAGNSAFEAIVDGTQTTINLPANTLSAGKNYEGYLDHLDHVVQSGAGGFGVDGNILQTAYTQFNVNTTASGSIIGSWTFGDTETDGSGVIVFMKDGTYYLSEDSEAGSGDPDGFERGTYTWNAETGAFTANAEADSNGEAGLSHPAGSPTVMVSGSTLTYTDTEGSTELSRVFDPSNPIVGAWQYGEGRPDFSSVYVFLANRVYFHALDNTTFEVGFDGMEKGTYVWDPASGDISTTVSVDTNGEAGLSNPVNGFRISIVEDELALRDGDQEVLHYLVLPNTPGQAVPQVTHWRFLKGRDHFQAANNQAPPISSWSVYVVVQTKLNLDAQAMEIRGGGIPGSYPLVLIGREWTFEKDYHSEAAMNAEFPAGGQITIELSGGFLGTMTQDLTLMSDQYPNTPYLTGTRFTDAQNFDSFTDFTLNWSDPGGFTANSGQTRLEVYRYYDDGEVFINSTIGAVSQGTIPAGTVYPGHTFYGYLEYTHARSVDGTGGFGISGTESRNAATDFTLAAPDSPLAGAWSYGDTSSDNSGVILFLNNGTYFHVEDVSASSSDPDGFERGIYEWDRDSGAFSVETEVDTNGSAGLSSLGDSLTLNISGGSLAIVDGGQSLDLVKVSSVSNDLIGGWQWGDGNKEFGGIFAFLDNGYYFGMEYTHFLGLSLEGGVERGTYSWDEENIQLVASAVLDTNGEQGLSHVDGEWSMHYFDDRLSIGDNRGGYSLFDAEKSEIMNRIAIYEPALESAFRNTLGKQNGPILRLDLQRIIKMDASGLGLTDLHGFEEAIHMQQLNLSDNELTDIWQVGDMRELRFLDLSNNQISDITYLSDLTKLVSLDLSSNDLMDTSGAGGLSDGFSVAATGVLAPLDGIDTLGTLKLANNSIVDLSALGTLPALKEVDLSRNQIADFSPLSSLSNLEKITLYENPVDLTEGSEQLNLLNAIATNTGARLVLDPPDPFGTFLSWDRDEANEQYRLIWTESGVLQRSSDLENWSNIDGAQSPYPIDANSGEPVFWRLDF